MYASLHIVDILAVIYALFAAIHGYRRGLSGELAGTLTAVLALVVGWQFFPAVGEQVLSRTRLDDSNMGNAFAFVLIVAAVYLLMLVVRWIARNLVDFKFKPPLEKLGGFLAGLVRAVVVVSILALLISVWGPHRLHEDMVRDSYVGRVIDSCVVPVYERLAEHVPRLRIPQPGAEAEPGRSPEEPVRPGPVEE